MEFMQSQEFEHWGLWTPLIGGLMLYLGLHLKLTKVDSYDE